MRVVLDSNVLLQIIPKISPFRKVFDAVLEERVVIIFSSEILLEYEEILQRELNADIADNVIRLIETLPNAEKHEIFYKWNLISSDADDNKFSDTAINSGADYLVTNDKHFNVLHEIHFPRVNIVSVNEFLRIIDSKDY